MDYVKVEGYDRLVRDMKTGAIINNDCSAIESRRKTKTLNNVVDDINNLKEEISEIKQLLREIARNGINSSL
jgi:hypothetical protein